MDENRTLSRVQTIASILTPLILGIGGWYFNQSQQDLSRSVSQLETTVATVQAMPPYFDMLVQKTDTAKAKLAAYALYMLKRDDPQMVVSLILATNREELKEVLVNLGSRDSVVYEILTTVLTSREGADTDSITGPTTTETAAQEILARIPVAADTGWAYFGTFNNGRWGHGPTVHIGPQLPTAGQVYETNRPLNLRDALPSPSYQMARAVGVIANRQHVRVEEVHPKISGNHVWARVTVIP